MSLRISDIPIHIGDIPAPDGYNIGDRYTINNQDERAWATLRRVGAGWEVIGWGFTCSTPWSPVSLLDAAKPARTTTPEVSDRIRSHQAGQTGAAGDTTIE